MTNETKHTATLDWYAAYPDTIRGQEPRIRNTMPAIRDNNTGKEICIFTNYSDGDCNEVLHRVNAHDDLVEALEDGVAMFQEGTCGGDAFEQTKLFADFVVKAEAALKKAGA